MCLSPVNLQTLAHLNEINLYEILSASGGSDHSYIPIFVFQLGFHISNPTLGPE